MPSRRWWIVVLLTAVFSMHGVLLISPSGGEAPGGAGAAQHEMAESSAAESLPDVAGVSLSGSEGALATSGEPLPATDPGHGIGAHLWSLCLAVLAGMALLGALMVAGRLTAAIAGTAVRLLRGIGRWPGPPRPPDLAALCLLRI